MLLCFGSPLVDIIARVDESFLRQYELPLNDAVSASEKHEKLFKELEMLACHRQPGGSVTNTARVTQWIVKSPHLVTYVGAVGTDSLGKMLKNCLPEEGIECIWVEHKDVPTGKCAVLVCGQNRTLCTNLGASKIFRNEDFLMPSVQKRLTDAKFVYLSAFFLGVSREISAKIAKQCHADKKFFIMNLGAGFLCNKYGDEIRELVSYANIVFGNYSEALEFAKTVNFGENHIQNVCAKINHLQTPTNTNNRITVVTRGASSILVAENGSVREFEVAEIQEKDLVDTNGAGDAFVGGFLAQYIQNCSIDECVKCGIWAAREIIQNIGCRFDSF